MKRAWGAGIFITVIVVAIVVFTRLRADRALTTHLENGKQFAARHLELLAHLPPILDETSGIAVSRTQAGVFWSHNDSGDGPRVYAIDRSGQLLATFLLEGAEARDWEDIALGPCLSNRPPQTPPFCLYLADIGDNGSRREHVTVYVAAEPLVKAGGDAPQTIAARSFQYRYPNGGDDAEALAVLPDGDVTIVSKGRSGTIGFFRIGRDAIVRAADSGEILLAEYIGDTGIPPAGEIGRLATAAAVAPDGTALAVRTYYEVYFFAAVTDGGLVRWSGPSRPCFLGDAEPQGEAIDYLDQNTLVLTSERSSGDAGLIHLLRC